MPLYEYRCEKGHRYEIREPFGSPATQPCTKCGTTAQRVLHAPAIAFKGSGWYKTDSRDSSAAREKKKSSASASSSAKSSSSESTSDNGKSKSSKNKSKSKPEKAAAD